MPAPKTLAAAVVAAAFALAACGEGECIITGLGQEICGAEKIDAWCRATDGLARVAEDFQREFGDSSSNYQGDRSEVCG